MRLLKKSELDVAKAQDRQREINEGAKLAGRVDALRETQAQEEKSLNDFRIRAISTINDEINAEVQKRDFLLDEIKNLEETNAFLKEQRIKLEAPIDLTEAWNEVKASESVIDDIRTIQKERDEQYKIDFEKLQKDNREVEFKKINLANDIRSYSEKIEYVNREVANVNKKIGEFEAYQKIRNKNLFSRETDITNREEITKVREENNVKKEIELTNKEKFLEDRRKMLLRAEQRLYGNNL